MELQQDTKTFYFLESLIELSKTEYPELANSIRQLYFLLKKHK